MSKLQLNVRLRVPPAGSICSFCILFSYPQRGCKKIIYCYGTCRDRLWIYLSENYRKSLFHKHISFHRKIGFIGLSYARFWWVMTGRVCNSGGKGNALSWKKAVQRTLYCGSRGVGVIWVCALTYRLSQLTGVEQSKAWGRVETEIRGRRDPDFPRRMG